MTTPTWARATWLGRARGRPLSPKSSAPRPANTDRTDTPFESPAKIEIPIVFFFLPNR